MLVQQIRHPCKLPVESVHEREIVSSELCLMDRLTLMASLRRSPSLVEDSCHSDIPSLLRVDEVEAEKGYQRSYLFIYLSIYLFPVRCECDG